MRGPTERSAGPDAAPTAPDTGAEIRPSNGCSSKASRMVDDPLTARRRRGRQARALRQHLIAAVGACSHP